MVFWQAPCGEYNLSIKYADFMINTLLLSIAISQPLPISLVGAVPRSASTQPPELITLHHTSSQISPSDDEWLKGYIGIIPYYQGQPQTSDFNFYYLQNIRGVSFTIQWVTGLKTFVTQQSVHQTSSHSPLAEWSLSKTCSLQLSSCAAAAVLQRCQVQTLLGGISRY